MSSEDYISDGTPVDVEPRKEPEDLALEAAAKKFVEDCNKYCAASDEIPDGAWRLFFRFAKTVTSCDQAVVEFAKDRLAAKELRIVELTKAVEDERIIKENLADYAMRWFRRLICIGEHGCGKWAV